MITKHAELFRKSPSWLYKLGSQLWIDRQFPRHLFIETTAACNLTCEYCPREKVKNHMRWELFRQIIDEASKYGPRSFSFHLFGEPFLYPHFFEAVEYTKKSNPKHTVLITSNGTLFDRYVDGIVASRIDKLIWSWRPEAKFSEETKAKLKQWGKLMVRILQEVTPKEAYDKWRDWRPIEIKSLHNYGGNIELKKFGARSIPGKRYPCYHLWLAPAVAHNGNILMCCNDPHQKEVIGKFPGMSIAEAWQKISTIRAAHMRGDYGGICANCDVWKTYPDLFFDWQKK